MFPRERLVRLLMGLFCQENHSLFGIVCKERIKLMKTFFFFFYLKDLCGIVSQYKLIILFVF